MKKLVCVIVAILILVSRSISAYAEELIQVPQEFIEISDELGNQYNICPELIQAICWYESRFDANAESKGCVGIMQINAKWHGDRMDRLGITDLKDIRQNMTVGVDYLAELFQDSCDPAEVLMIYHGEHDIESQLSQGKISKYAESILELSRILERRNGK